MKQRIIYILAILLAASGCSLHRKMRELQSGSMNVSLSLAKEQDYIPDILRDTTATRDTFTVQDGENTVLIMKAVKDENGEMVAHDVIDAAIVQARFRNVAERHGKVDIQYQIIVPEKMQDTEWQLRFQPMMHLLGDTLALDRVIITGENYRKAQLRGYEQYNKFLSSIITDTTRFVNIHLLELFIERNIPQLYAFKTDSSAVSNQEFASVYGVTEQEAIDHYTNKIAKKWNHDKWLLRDRMYRKYVKVPIDTSGIRLDTVMKAENGDFIYEYVQTVSTRPKLRKVDIVLKGDVYQEDKQIYRMPDSPNLTFYISSLSSFVDNTEKYISKIIHRSVEENTACYIDFEVASHRVNESLSHNASEIGRIKDNLRSLMSNEVYDLDSVIVRASASPEGEMDYNKRLSQKRSESISTYFSKWMEEIADSLEQEEGVMIDEFGKVSRNRKEKVPMLASSLGENWDMLDRIIENDTTLTDSQKNQYRRLASITNLDERERRLQSEEYYRYLRESIYPKLRTVRFDFYLHRKGMVKDTIHTTELDTVYMNGVQAIRDRDYQKALTSLRPYNDFNTAIAYVSLDYNASAMAILETLEPTAQVNYMLALLYSRAGDDRKAVECYMKACRQEHTYIHRGNLDPEIAILIKRYGLNKQEEEEELSYS